MPMGYHARHAHLWRIASCSFEALKNDNVRLCGLRGPNSPIGSGLAQQAQARAQHLQAGGPLGMEALYTAMHSSTAARSLVEDMQATLNAAAAGERLQQEALGAWGKSHAGESDGWYNAANLDRYCRRHAHAHCGECDINDVES